MMQTKKLQAAEAENYDEAQRLKASSEPLIYSVTQTTTPYHPQCCRRPSWRWNKTPSASRSMHSFALFVLIWILHSISARACMQWYFVIRTDPDGRLHYAGAQAEIVEVIVRTYATHNHPNVRTLCTFAIPESTLSTPHCHWQMVTLDSVLQSTNQLEAAIKRFNTFIDEWHDAEDAMSEGNFAHPALGLPLAKVRMAVMYMSTALSPVIRPCSPRGRRCCQCFDSSTPQCLEVRERECSIAATRHIHFTI